MTPTKESMEKARRYLMPGESTKIEISVPEFARALDTAIRQERSEICREIMKLDVLKAIADWADADDIAYGIRQFIVQNLDGKVSAIRKRGKWEMSEVEFKFAWWERINSRLTNWVFCNILDRHKFFDFGFRDVYETRFWKCVRCDRVRKK